MIGHYHLRVANATDSKHSLPPLDFIPLDLDYSDSGTPPDIYMPSPPPSATEVSRHFHQYAESGRRIHAKRQPAWLKANHMNMGYGRLRNCERRCRQTKSQGRMVAICALILLVVGFLAPSQVRWMSGRMCCQRC